MGEQKPRYSKAAKTGHTIFLTLGFRKNPICPHHNKRAIICEPPDEIGAQRWFCIDCILVSLYEGISKRTLEKLKEDLEDLQNRIVFKSTTEAQAKQWRIQALGDVMETLGKLLGEK